MLAQLWASFNKEKLNHHFVLVEAPEELVAQEILVWGEASWWPPRCQMRFRKLTSGEIEIGTLYEQKLNMAMVKPWSCRVTKLSPGKEIERTFLGGLLVGRENVSVESRYNGTKVDYNLYYQVPGLVDKIIWKIFFRRMHDKNIRMILAALKSHCEAKVAPREAA